MTDDRRLQNFETLLRIRMGELYRRHVVAHIFEKLERQILCDVVVEEDGLNITRHRTTDAEGILGRGQSDDGVAKVLRD